MFKWFPPAACCVPAMQEAQCECPEQAAQAAPAAQSQYALAA